LGEASWDSGDNKWVFDIGYDAVGGYVEQGTNWFYISIEDISNTDPEWDYELIDPFQVGFYDDVDNVVDPEYFSIITFLRRHNDGTRGLSLMPVFPDLIPDEITTYDQLSAYAGDVVDLVSPSNFDGDVYDHTIGLFEDSSSLSDSGYRVAFVSTTDGSDSELFLYRFGSYQYSSFQEPDQINVTVTTYEPEIELEETDPYISPDGCLLVFTAVHPDGAEIGGSSVYALDIRDATGALDEPVLVSNFAYETAVRYEPTVTNVDPEDGEFAVTFSANCTDGSSAPNGEINRIYQITTCDIDIYNFGIDQQTYLDSLDIHYLNTTLRAPVVFPDEYMASVAPAFLALGGIQGMMRYVFSDGHPTNLVNGGCGSFMITIHPLDWRHFMIPNLTLQA